MRLFEPVGVFRIIGRKVKMWIPVMFLDCWCGNISNMRNIVRIFPQRLNLNLHTGQMFSVNFSLNHKPLNC